MIKYKDQLDILKESDIFLIYTHKVKDLFQNVIQNKKLI
jgi:hypothetical protein